MVFLALIIAHFRYRVNEKNAHFKQKRKVKTFLFLINSTYISI